MKRRLHSIRWANRYWLNLVSMQTINGGTLITSPVSYPTFALRGRTYQARFTNGALFRLEKAGIRSDKLDEEIQAFSAAGKNVMLAVTLASCVLGTESPDGDFHPISLSPEQIADAISTADQMRELNAVLIEALRKVQPSQTIPDQTAAADQIQ